MSSPKNDQNEVQPPKNLFNSPSAIKRDIQKDIQIKNKKLKKSPKTQLFSNEEKTSPIIIYQPQNEQEDEYSGLAASYSQSECNEKQQKKFKGKTKKFESNPFTCKKISGDTYDFKTKWKTEICKNWQMYGQCKFGKNCAFAHGDIELKTRKLSNNYKTKKCKQFFEVGYCSYGSRCQFSHKDYNTNEDYNNYHLNSFFEFLNCPFINENLLKRPRLITFENLAHSTPKESKKNRRKLYEDLIQVKREMRSSEDSTGSECSEELNKINNKVEYIVDNNVD